MPIVKRALDFVTMGSERPARRLLAYYLIVAAVVSLLIYFFPFVNLAFSGERLAELSGSRVLTDALPTATGPLQMPPRLEVVISATLSLIGTLVLMLPVSWVYMSVQRDRVPNSTIVETLIILPIAVAGVVLVVKNSLALAFSLAGIVAAVRFRVALEDSKDAVFVFGVMALGLACGVQLETAAVLSVGLCAMAIVLSYSDFARTPPSLEGERAAKHFERAVAIANRTSQFVARLDREILDSMAPAQLDALQARLDKQKSKFGLSTEAKTGEEEGPRFDGRITVHVGDPDQAQAAVEGVLEAKMKRWKMVRIERTDGEARIVYAVRPKKGISLESISETLTSEAAPFVANVEVERWA